MTLAELLAAKMGTLPVPFNSMLVHHLTCDVLTKHVGLYDKDLENVASILVTAFLGFAPQFNPRAMLAKISPEGLEKLERVMDETDTGSEGPFIFFQLNRNERENRFVEGSPWQFIRHNRYLGDCRYFLREKTHALDPMTVATAEVGAPDIDVYVRELAVEVKQKRRVEFPAASIPGFSHRELIQRLRDDHNLIMAEKRQHGTTMIVVYVREHF